MTRRPAIMIQGTGSNVGKSLIVAGLARAFANRGLRVAPFKPQNMSNNAGIASGGEIGRAQITQARAARIAPSIDMNPVLLKPETETGAQVIVQGKRLASVKARDYGALKGTLLPAVLQSFERLSQAHDLILVEGAGSPAETNLRSNDIANMGFAESADVPVILIGDIDRGGVIASLVGTHAVLSEPDRGLIKGFMINRFRGDPSLFSEGIVEIEQRTGWPGLGIVPHFEGACDLPAEDSLALQESGVPSPGKGKKFNIAVLRLNRIANFDDLDPLRMEPAVRLEFVSSGETIPVDADLVIIPGSKSTLADLEQIRAQGWDIDLAAHHRRGGQILGICGGYQILGRTIADPDGIEGEPGERPGLGLLDVETIMQPEKATRCIQAKHVASGVALAGYEIHLGVTDGPDRARPFAKLNDRTDGATSGDGLVFGTYFHGAFTSDAFRAAFLEQAGQRSTVTYDSAIEAALDGLATLLETNLDLDQILAIATSRAQSDRPG